MLCQFVSNLPAKRIKKSATMLKDCARRGSSKWIPPGPSEPANIPTARNSRSDGTPRRLDIFLAIVLRGKSIDRPKTCIHKEVIFID